MGVRLGPDADSSRSQEVDSVFSAPPGVRRTSIRVPILFSHADGRVGSPPADYTDASLEFSAAAYQGSEILIGHLEGQKFLVRPKGTTSRGHSGAEAELSQRTKVGCYPCCTAATQVAVQPAHEVEEFSNEMARGLEPRRLCSREYMDPFRNCGVGLRSVRPPLFPTRPPLRHPRQRQRPCIYISTFFPLCREFRIDVECPMARSRTRRRVKNYPPMWILGWGPKKGPRVTPMQLFHRSERMIHGVVLTRLPKEVNPKATTNPRPICIADIRDRAKGLICVVAIEKVRPLRPQRRHSPSPSSSRSALRSQPRRDRTQYRNGSSQKKRGKVFFFPPSFSSGLAVESLSGLQLSKGF